jgi:hypothetical protein
MRGGFFVEGRHCDASRIGYMVPRNDVAFPRFETKRKIKIKRKRRIKRKSKRMKKSMLQEYVCL